MLVVQISATLRFPPCGEPRSIARVRVTIRDVSEPDGPAATVAQLDLPSVQVPATGLDLPVTLRAELPDPSRSYALRAHADADGSGSVAAGDFVSTTTHLVGNLAGAAGAATVLPLEPVTG